MKMVKDMQHHPSQNTVDLEQAGTTTCHEAEGLQSGALPCPSSCDATAEKTIHEQTLINLVGAYNSITWALKQQFDPFGITVQQYNILKILREQREKPATINLLKERMLDKMSDASRIVERLVQKGLVSRTVCVFDRRAVDISITQTGLDLLTLMDTSFTAADILGGGLSDRELEQINPLLDKIRNHPSG